MKIFFDLYHKMTVTIQLLVVLAVFSVSTIQLNAQTPGLIIKPATGGGSAVLDPDGDGYVSAKTNGVQLGFTVPPNNDVTQSEIPFVAIVRPDPQGDVLRGGSGGPTEIVGTDAAGNNAVMMYKDATNLMFRFRMGGYAPNTKSYSVLIDTDGKMGFTGVNADPNAVSGNPGFEIEIILATNFYVNVYKVDGTITPVQTYSASFDTNCQQSIAVSTAGGDFDYLYDFYVPFSQLTSIVFSAPTTPTSITGTTPLRYATTTTMNKFPFVGNTAVSDIGGVTGSGSIDNQLITFIDAQTPTVPGNEVLDRSACPIITGSYTNASTTVTGTSTEADGTVIQVYKNGVAAGASVTVSGGNWSRNGLTFINGDVITATATASGKGTSIDNCSSKTVSSPCTPPDAPTALTFAPSGKFFDVTFTCATAGTKTITVYNSNGTINASTTSTATGPTTVSISVGTPKTSNSKPPDGTYFATVTLSDCESAKYEACKGTTNDTAPTVTSPIVNGATTVSGTGIVGHNIYVYADGVQIGTSYTLASTNWSVTVPALSTCQVITAKQAKTSTNDAANSGDGSCFTASTSITVTRTAATPTITTAVCLPTSGQTISGSSSEANGTTITLYTPNSSGSSIGTAVVSNGAWSVTGLALSAGTVVVAKVTAGSCLTGSADSSPITVSTQTSLAAYTIGINQPVEGRTYVSGTLTGGAYPAVLNVYIDNVLIGTGTTVTSAGSWTVSGLMTTDLYINGIVKVTISSGTGCESVLSSTSATVQCTAPIEPTYTGGDYSYCYAGNGLLLTTTQAGVIYQFVDGSGVAKGPTVMGTGGSVNLYTYPLVADLNNIYVKAFKILSSSCFTLSTTAVNFNNQIPSPTVTFSNTTLGVVSGNTSVNLAYTSKSVAPSADTYTIAYSVDAKAQGFVDVTSQTAIPSSPIVLTVPAAAANRTYSGTITIYNTSGNSCTMSYGFTITVYSTTSAPVIASHPSGITICSGSTTPLSVTAFPPAGLTYQWLSSSSFSGTYANVSGGAGATTANYTTAALAATTYYKVNVTNGSYGTTASNVAIVTVNTAPGAAGVITGSSSVPAGRSYVNYSITPISTATSYSWSYSGIGATIYGNTNSVYVSFSKTATSGTLSVTPVNSCGSGTPATKAITITHKGCVVSNKNSTTKL